MYHTKVLVLSFRICYVYGEFQTNGISRKHIKPFGHCCPAIYSAYRVVY